MDIKELLRCLNSSPKQLHLHIYSEQESLLWRWIERASKLIQIEADCHGCWIVFFTGRLLPLPARSFSFFINFRFLLSSYFYFYQSVVVQLTPAKSRLAKSHRVWSSLAESNKKKKKTKEKNWLNLVMRPVIKKTTNKGQKLTCCASQLIRLISRQRSGCVQLL